MTAFASIKHFPNFETPGLDFIFMIWRALSSTVKFDIFQVQPVSVCTQLIYILFPDKEKHLQYSLQFLINVKPIIAPFIQFLFNHAAVCP